MDFSSLFNWLFSILADLNPFVVIKEWQEGVMLRLGKFNRMLPTGLHFKIPFIDTYWVEHTVMTTSSLPAQSLYTQDRQSIVVKAVIKHKVTDVKTFILEIYDRHTAISDITQGVIKMVIMELTFEECLNNDLDNTITKKVRSEVKKYGVEVQQVTLTDIAPIRTIRLMNDNPTVKTE